MTSGVSAGWLSRDPLVSWVLAVRGESIKVSPRSRSIGCEISTLRIAFWSWRPRSSSAPPLSHRYSTGSLVPSGRTATAPASSPWLNQTGSEIVAVAPVGATALPMSALTKVDVPARGRPTTAIRRGSVMCRVMLRAVAAMALLPSCSMARISSTQSWSSWSDVPPLIVGPPAALVEPW